MQIPAHPSIRILVAALILIGLAAGAGAYLFFKGGPDKDAAPAATAEALPAGEAVQPPKGWKTGPGPVERGEISPHKALYKITLVAAHGGTEVVNISGKMFYQWESACDAWISDHRFKLLYEYADSPAMEISSDFSTFETFDGKSFDFTSRRRRDGELYEELRGRAVMRADGGEAAYTMPASLSYDLEPKTLFPMAHTLALLNAIRQGKKFYAATVFDGSDEDGPVLINAFIGAPVNVMAGLKPSPDIDASLLNTPAVRVRMGFFPLGSDEPGADYEMSLVLHENGVISEMVIEYDDFTVAQKLVALEPLEPQACDIDEK